MDAQNTSLANIMHRNVVVCESDEDMEQRNPYPDIGDEAAYPPQSHSHNRLSVDSDPQHLKDSSHPAANKFEPHRDFYW